MHASNYWRVAWPWRGNGSSWLLMRTLRKQTFKLNRGNWSFRYQPGVTAMYMQVTARVRPIQSANNSQLTCGFGYETAVADTDDDGRRWLKINLQKNQVGIMAHDDAGTIWHDLPGNAAINRLARHRY